MTEVKKGTIRIESILGGHSPTTHFARADQFRASIGIDPSQPTEDGTSSVSIIASGLLRPNGVSNIGSTTITHAPMWLESNPKDGNVYVYDYAGSVYTLNANFDTMTGIGDLNDGGSSHGNGCAYYDNYIYFARDTTVARYGPLNGTPAFTDDYWVSTLGKSRLTEDSRYPNNNRGSLRFPTHVMHRHSDGRLYIADVVDGKGTIHFISTSKTTVEGDTDNGSTYNKVQVGYGLIPTCMETYGGNLVAAFYEGSGTFLSQARAKVAFWDTTSQNVNKITWVEFADPYISAMKNINGVLYVASGRVGSDGFRISRYVGDYTFQEVAFLGTGAMPFPDAMDGQSQQLLFGSYTDVAGSSGCVYSLGLNNAALSSGLFAPFQVSSLSSLNCVTSLHLSDNWNLGFLAPTVGWSNGSSGLSNNGLDIHAAAYTSGQVAWWSQTYRIGQPFKITKVRIPLAAAVGAGTNIVPTIYVDSGDTSFDLTPITGTNDLNKLAVIRRSDENGKPITGQNDFFLALKWGGSSLAVVSLPIIIEYELLNE